MASANNRSLPDTGKKAPASQATEGAGSQHRGSMQPGIARRLRTPAMRRGESHHALNQAATAYAHAGWLVHPVKVHRKEPLTHHGVKDATNDLEQIRSWWSRWPQANIGLAIPQGLLVLDIDSTEALGYLQAEDLCLPTTTWATTGRGRHLWYSTGRTTVQVTKLASVQQEGAEIRMPEQKPWPEIPEDTFHGLAGRYVRKIEPHSKADPAGILVQFAELISAQEEV